MKKPEISPTPWRVGVSIDRTYAQEWPVYRLLDMNNPSDQDEIEANRKLMDAAPALLSGLTWALQYGTFDSAIDNPLHAGSLDLARAALLAAGSST